VSIPCFDEAPTTTTTRAIMPLQSSCLRFVVCRQLDNRDFGYRRKLANEVTAHRSFRLWNGLALVPREVPVHDHHRAIHASSSTRSKQRAIVNRIMRRLFHGCCGQHSRSLRHLPVCHSHRTDCDAYVSTTHSGPLPDSGTSHWHQPLSQSPTLPHQNAARIARR
jgi:hypothetical protein